MIRADAFNPYYKWLGIPPQDQPADPYRLLGIARFEEDPEVILAAADRQMAHIRTFQNGAFSTTAQALLTEIAGAKLALLNEGQRRIVDKLLQQQSAPSPQIAPPPPQLPQYAWPAPAHIPVALPKRRRRRSAFGTFFGLLVLIGIISAFVATVYVVISQWDQISAGKPGTSKNILPQGVSPSAPIRRRALVPSENSESLLTDREKEIIDSSNRRKAKNPTGTNDENSHPKDSHESSLGNENIVKVPPQLRPQGSPAPVPTSTIVEIKDCWNRRRQEYALEQFSLPPAFSISVEKTAPGLGQVSVDARRRLIKLDETFSLMFADCADVKLDVVISRDPKSLTDGHVAIVSAAFRATNGENAPLTHKTIVAVTGSVKRKYNDFLGRLRESIQEHSATKAWLESPLGKPPAQKNAAIARFAELERLIPAAQSDAIKFEAEIARLQAICDFVAKECWIKLRIQ